MANVLLSEITWRDFAEIFRYLIPAEKPAVPLTDGCFCGSSWIPVDDSGRSGSVQMNSGSPGFVSAAVLGAELKLQKEI